MSDLATITLTGRLTRDGELRYTTNGTAVLKLSVACNRWKNNANKTSFYECELWGKFGEAKAKIATKGTHVMVSGTLDIDEYDGANGKSRKAVVTVNILEPSPSQVQDQGDSFTSPGASPPARTSQPLKQPASRDNLKGPESFEDDVPFVSSKKGTFFDDDIPF